MVDKIEFERLNTDWNADPNVPDLKIEVKGSDVILTFYLNAFVYKQFCKGDKARLTFHNCLQYSVGNLNDEGFYCHGQSRFKKFGVKWGEFYLVHGSNWQKEFPDVIKVMETNHEKKHFLFYFRDETFECIASSYSLEFLPVEK